MNLKTKFGLLISSLVISIIAGVTIFLFITESNFLLNEMEKDRVNMIKNLAQVAKDVLIKGDPIPLSNYLKMLKNTNGFNYAALTDPYNKVIYHTDAFLSGTVLSDDASQKTLNAKELIVQKYTTQKHVPILDLALPVYEKNVKIALVRIGFNQEVLAEKVAEAMSVTRQRIIIVALIGLAIGLLGTVLLTGMMVEPINKMAQGAKIVGQGNLNHVIDINTEDELGYLAKEFNRMSGKLKELDQLKSDFVSSVTHELRSPLLSLRLYIDLFLKGTAGAVSDKQKEYLTVMRNCSERLHRFIDDLLDVAKIERGMMEVSPQAVDITPVISETIELFKPQVDKKNVKLNVTNMDKLPQVKADAERTRQVLTNLLSNAVKFTPDNGVITVSGFTNTKESRLEISVRDTGIGIPKDKLNSIFNKFEQVKISRDHNTGSKGTGLGLAIVKGIMEAQGGTIWVDSELNAGSTFTFSLPLVKEA